MLYHEDKYELERDLGLRRAALEENGLGISWQKSELLWCFIERDNQKPVQLDGTELKSVQQRKYVGLVLNHNENVDLDVRSYMKSAWGKLK